MVGIHNSFRGMNPIPNNAFPEKDFEPSSDAVGMNNNQDIRDNPDNIEAMNTYQDTLGRAQVNGGCCGDWLSFEGLHQLDPDNKLRGLCKLSIKKLINI